MSEDTETPIVNDAITSDDAGFAGDVGDQPMEELEVSEESVEAAPEGEAVEVQAETKEELKEEIQEAIEEGASEEEVKDMIREFTIKVNGQEKQVKLDLNNEEDIIRRLQLAEVSQISMQERRELEKSYEEEVRNLLQNPAETLRELGLDPLKLGEEWIRKEVDERKKSPELRAKEQLERELSEARAELKRQENQAQSARMAQLEAEESQKIEAEIEAALDANTSLPRSQKTRSRIADALLWSIENAEELGIDPNSISVADVIPSVEQEIRNELQEFMGQLPEEMMEEYIGKKNLDRMREKRLSSMKTNNVSNLKSTSKSVESKEEPKTKSRVKSKDYFRNL